MKHQDCMVIASATDEQYVRGTAVLLQSLLDHRSDLRPMDIVLLSDNLTNASKEKLQSIVQGHRNVTLNYREPDNSILAGLSTHGGRNTAIYYTILLPQLFHDYSKVLFMDADMLVHRDIGELWDTPIGDAPWAACRDAWVRRISQPHGLLMWKECNLPADMPYYNTGLFLLQPPYWNQTDFTKRIIAFLKKHKEQARYWDQDGMNAIAGHACVELPEHWNRHGRSLLALEQWNGSLFDKLRLRLLIREDSITHFITWKPWNAQCRHPKREQWLATLSKTPWADDVRAIRNRYLEPCIAL